MGFLFEERRSDSPYVETLTQGRTVDSGSTIRPAEIHWHMVFVKYRDQLQLIVTGPLTTAGVVPYTEGAEILWIKFRLGTYMPHLPLRSILDKETRLPEGAGKSFWLKGRTWQFPDFDNADTFVEWLARDEVLVRDPLVDAVLQGTSHEMAPRTVRHRFLRTAGVTQNQVYQVRRAEQAAVLLRNGVSILDTVDKMGYFDQPHLTRSLKQWIGYTPSRLISRPDDGMDRFAE